MEFQDKGDVILDIIGLSFSREICLKRSLKNRSPRFWIYFAISVMPIGKNKISTQLNRPSIGSYPHRFVSPRTEETREIFHRIVQII